MVNIRGELVQWDALRGAAPHVEEYRIRVKLRTIIGISGDIPQYRNEHEISVVIPPDYPNSPPMARMISNPQPFHPNWYTDGRWCPGIWIMSESLGQFVTRMLLTLQFDLEITNPDSAANPEAEDWYNRHCAGGLFPIDRTVLPDPTVNREEAPAAKKTFNIVDQASRFKING